MLTINYSKRFKRDYQREESGRHGKKLRLLLEAVITVLESGNSFPRRYFDHALSGEWNDCRDCHLKPDLILIYRKSDDNSIEFVRLGSHSELGL